MPPQMYKKDTKLRIGVLLAPPPVQLLDLAPVDLFYMLSKEYLGPINFLPRPIKDLAIHHVEILYIADHEDASVTILRNISKAPTTNDEDDHTHNTKSSTNPLTVPKKDLTLTSLTAHATIQVTAPLTSPTVQPGNLNVLIIPGPDPSATPSEHAKQFIRSHATSGQTDIITICTGIFPACYSGICDGHTVTAPRGLLSPLSKQFPNVKKFEDVRWTMDHLSPSKVSTSTSTSINPLKDSNDTKDPRKAELWTSAGITNGHDCIAAYIRAHFNKELGGVVLRMADVGERAKAYDVGKTREGAWWVSTILMAVIKKVWRGK